MTTLLILVANVVKTFETSNVKRAFSEGKNVKRFKKILVGVDLSNGDRFVAEETPATTMDARVLMGNTAEKLLPFLRCSVIAIKPDELKSPVS